MHLTAQIKLPPLWKRPAVLRLLIIAVLAEIGYAVLNISTMPIYLQQERGMGESVIGFIVVGFLLSEAVFKGPMGHFADRYGCRTLMVGAPFITIVTSLLTAVVPHDSGVWEVLALMFLRILDGIGAAMIWPAAFALMGHTVEDSERQNGMSLINMCYLLGVALALPLGGAAEDLLNTRSAGLYLAAAVFAIVALVAWRFVPDERLSSDEIEAVEGEGFKIHDLIASFKAIPAYVLLAVITFAGIGFPMFIVKLFALDEFKMSATQFGALVFPGAIAMAVLSVPMSRYGQSVGRARAVHIGLGMCAVGLSFLCLGAFFSVFRAGWVLALGGIPIGLGFLLAIPAWFASVSDIDCRRRAAYLGAIMTAQGIGAMVGGAVGPILYEKLVPVGERVGLGESFGHYSPFIGCALCLTAGWLISLRILRDPEKPVELRVEEPDREAAAVG
jgi:DHA1 family multidrug resistance protein-like MFS transporter